MANPKYRPHPLVEKLTAGKGEAGAVKLLGYFGSTIEGTVKVYLHAIFEKLGVGNRTELAIRADQVLGTYP